MTSHDGPMPVHPRAPYVGTPVAAARAGRSARNEIVVDPRSRGAARVGETAHPRLTYRPDLDGLRAIAVLGVLASHATLPNPLPTATVGVTAFFVLSGYLITGLLLKERRQTGGISLRGFYVRRFRRLGPGLAVLLAFVTVVGVAGGYASSWAGSVLVTIGYVANWPLVQGGGPSPLAHAWSLSIEEQFYIVWPALLVLGGRRWAIVTAVAGIALAFGLRSVVDGQTSYYSTFTRIDAIFAGCLLAIAPVRLPRWAGLAGLVLLAMACLPMDNTLRLPLSTIGALGVIAGGVPALGRIAAFGKRAYGIYLWDFPLTLLLGPGIGGLAAICAAEISYRTIEARFRSGRRRQADLLVTDGRIAALEEQPEPAAPGLFPEKRGLGASGIPADAR